MSGDSGLVQVQLPTYLVDLSAFSRLTWSAQAHCGAGIRLTLDGLSDSVEISCPYHENPLCGFGSFTLYEDRRPRRRAGSAAARSCETWPRGSRFHAPLSWREIYVDGHAQHDHPARNAPAIPCDCQWFAAARRALLLSR